MTEENIPYHEQRLARKNGLAAPLPTKKERKPIPKKSAKKIASEKAEKEARGGGESELVKFFKRAIKQMTGYCAETGIKTETKIYKYAIRSICHILPKSTCKSVKYHPCNWIELEPGFHFKFDAMSWDEREKLGCWPVIREKLIMVWPDLHPDERRHFPPKLRDWIEQNEPF